MHNQLPIDASLMLKIEILSESNFTEDILSVSNTYTNGASLPVSQLEQGGALAPLKFYYFYITAF